MIPGDVRGGCGSLWQEGATAMKALLALAIAVGLACASPASAIVVNFDDEATGSKGATFTSGPLTFSTTAGGEIFVVQLDKHVCPSTGGNCSLDLRIDFAFPVENLSFTVTPANVSSSVLDVLVGLAGGGSAAFSFTDFTSGAGAENNLLSFGVLSDIISLDITEDDPGGFGYDNFTFDAVAVPAPAAWATLLVGFGVVGGALRRRGRKP
jgi:hypothetical protein